MQNVVMETRLPDLNVLPILESVDAAGGSGFEASYDRGEGVGHGVSEFPKRFSVFRW
jgi:hypothetical protein